MYAWRWAYHYTAKPKTIDPNRDPIDDYWERESEKLLEAKGLKEEEDDWLDEELSIHDIY